MNSDGRVWGGLVWFAIGQVVGICERGNQPSGFMKCGKFIDCLWNHQLLQKDFSVKLVSWLENVH
jgi:hypothetical protein